MADDFWSGLGGLLGSGNADLYGDLLTDKQRKALLFKEIGGGLDEISRRAAEAGKPSLMPGGKGWLGSALSGYGAGANAAGEGMLKTLGDAQKIRAMRRQQKLLEELDPIQRELLRRQLAQTGGGPPGGPPAGIPAAPPGMPAAPLSPTAPPGAAPAGGPPASYSGPTNAELGAPPLAVAPTNAELGAPPVAAAAGPPTPAERLEWNQTVGPGKQYLPLEDWVAQKRAGQQPGGPITPPPPLKNTGTMPGGADPNSQFAGLLSGGQPGGLDQVVGPDGQPLTGGGLLPSMLASYTGGTAGATLPFRLASATPTSGTTPGATGGADILDTVVAPLESGNRNIHQRVTSPSISSAQGYYQITNSTWKDTAPRAGVDLDKFPTAMSAPREVQKQVAQKLYDERGLQPWADFNPAVAAATGYRRGGRFAGAGPDAGRIPAGGGDQMQAISALLRLTGDNGEADPLASLPSLTGGAPDTLIPSPGGQASLPVRQATAALAPYAIGNAVLGGPSSVAGVDQAMSGKIEAMVQAMPPDVRERFLIISGFRDAQRQAQVNPGVTDSRHMHGRAVDLAKDPVVLNWINQNPQFGLGFPLQADPREINHLEMIDPSGQRLPIMRAQYSPGGGAPASASAAPGASSSTQSGIIPGLGITPEALATLNSMYKAAGVDAPFGSLLETYYKSPDYLKQSERAKEEVQTEFAGPKAAAVAAAQQKYIQENEGYKTKLEIAKELLTKGGLVRKPDGGFEQIKTITDALAAVDNAKQTGDVKEYEYYRRQELEAGQIPDTFQKWDASRRKASATTINTAEGFEAAQTKARVGVDAKIAQDVAEQAITGRRLMPVLDELSYLADKTPEGWRGTLAPTVGKTLATLGVAVPQGASNAEAFQALAQRLVPIVREPGATSQGEMALYLSAGPALSGTANGRRQIIEINRAMIQRSQEIAKVYRENIGKPDLYEKLAELDKPLFTDEQRAAMQGATAQQSTAAPQTTPPPAGAIQTPYGTITPVR